MKSIKALAVGFWNVCKQLPPFFAERLAAYADEKERENEARARGEFNEAVKEFSNDITVDCFFNAPSNEIVSEFSESAFIDMLGGAAEMVNGTAVDNFTVNVFGTTTEEFIDIKTASKEVVDFLMGNEGDNGQT